MSEYRLFKGHFYCLELLFLKEQTHFKEILLMLMIISTSVCVFTINLTFVLNLLLFPL